MTKQSHYNYDQESGVSSLIEYIIISGVLMILLVITLSVVNTVFIDNPSNQLTYYAFTDIANGVSTRIVDFYTITDAPYTILSDGSQTTMHTEEIVADFDIPDDVAGQYYEVLIEDPTFPGQGVVVTRGNVKSSVSLGGIGSSFFGGASGNTTGAGMNRISYSSSGF